MRLGRRAAQFFRDAERIVGRPRKAVRVDVDDGHGTVHEIGNLR